MINEFFVKYHDIIDTVSNIFVALGTVGSVITALYLAYKDSKPNLKVYSTVGVIFPDESKHLWVSCVNTSKQKIICSGFSFQPNKFWKKSAYTFKIVKEIREYQSSFPRSMEYSAKLDMFYDLQIFADEKIKNILSGYRWIAKIQLKFWRVTADTNVKQFQGKFSDVLIDTILEIVFKKA